MRRREFILALGGAAAWPLTVRAQQPAGGIKHLGVLMAFGADDLELKAYLTGFRQGLEKRGWLEGRNLLVDYRLGVVAVGQMAAAQRLRQMRLVPIMARGDEPMSARVRRATFPARAPIMRAPALRRENATSRIVMLSSAGGAAPRPDGADVAAVRSSSIRRTSVDSPGRVTSVASNRWIRRTSMPGRNVPQVAANGARLVISCCFGRRAKLHASPPCPSHIVPRRPRIIIAPSKGLFGDGE